MQPRKESGKFAFSPIAQTLTDFEVISIAPIVPIVEVIGPAAQGKSIPLLCGGADGHRYYVKGQQTNRASLWREWICGYLAEAMGLPLPPFAAVQLDPALVKGGNWGQIKIYKQALSLHLIATYLIAVRAYQSSATAFFDYSS